MTDPPDDLATRGRAIFQRLRGHEGTTAEAAPQPADADADPSPTEPALADDDLEAFSTPPPPDRPPPASHPPPARRPPPAARLQPAPLALGP